MDYSYTLPSENAFQQAEISKILESYKTIINAYNKFISFADEKQCYSVTFHDSVSIKIYAYDHKSESFEVIENDLHKSNESLFMHSKPFPEIPSNNFKHCNSLESSKITKPCSVLIT